MATKKMTFEVEVEDKASADFRKLERTIKDALEAASKELDNAGEAGEDFGKKVKDGSQDAEKAIKNAGNEGPDFGRKVKAGGDDAKDGLDRASAAADEFKDEAYSSSKEAAASFSGEFEDVADLVQETLANALAGLGPAGAAAGMAAAVGIGALVGWLQSSTDEANAAREKVIALADELRDVDGDISRIDWAARMREFADTIADPKSWFEPWQEASRTNAEVIQEDADRLGLTYQALFQGLAGDTDAAQVAIQEVNEKIAEQSAIIDGATNSYSAEASAALSVRNELLAQRDALEEAAEATEDAQSLAEAYSEAIDGSAASVQEYNEKVEEQNSLLDENASAFAGNVGNQMTYIEAQESATAALAENGASLDLNTEAGRNNMNALLDLAGAGTDYAQSLADQGASQRDVNNQLTDARSRFIETATAMGMSADEAAAYADQLGLIPGSVRTTMEAETETAQVKIDRWIERNDGRKIRINFDATGNARSVVGGAALSMADGGSVDGEPFHGLVQGPGTGRSDQVLIAGSDGEIMFSKRAVDFWGEDNLLGMLDYAHKHADGGVVGRTPTGIGTPALAGGVVRIHPDDIRDLAMAMVAAARGTSDAAIADHVRMTRAAGRTV